MRPLLSALVLLSVACGGPVTGFVGGTAKVGVEVGTSCPCATGYDPLFVTDMGGLARCLPSCLPGSPDIRAEDACYVYTAKLCRGAGCCSWQEAP